MAGRNGTKIFQTRRQHETDKAQSKCPAQPVVQSLRKARRMAYLKSKRLQAGIKEYIFFFSCPRGAISLMFSNLVHVLLIFQGS